MRCLRRPQKAQHLFSMYCRRVHFTSLKQAVHAIVEVFVSSNVFLMVLMHIGVGKKKREVRRAFLVQRPWVLFKEWYIMKKPFPFFRPRSRGKV